MGTAGGNRWTRVGCRDSQRHWPSPHIQAARDLWLFRLKTSLVICTAVAKLERAAVSRLQRGLEGGRRQIFAYKTTEPSQQRDKSSVAHLLLKRHVISQPRKDRSLSLVALSS